MNEKIPFLRRLSSDEIGGVDFISLPNREIMGQNIQLHKQHSGISEMAKMLESQIQDGLNRIERMLSLQTRKNLTVPEAALLFDCSVFTIRNWLRGGKLKGLKSGDNQQARWLINKKDLERFIEKRVNQVEK